MIASLTFIFGCRVSLDLTLFKFRKASAEGIGFGDGMGIKTALRLRQVFTRQGNGMDT